jgi:hypothetical protein
MRMPFLAIALAASPAVSQDLRAGDAAFSRDALNERLSGQIVEFHDNSTASYAANGAYAYTYAPGDPPNVGTWTATEDGAVCVTFANGRSRCDTYVLSRDRLTMIVTNGDRYPARTETPIDGQSQGDQR